MTKMQAATHILHAAAGAPSYPDTSTGVCRLCGQRNAGLLFDAWVKPTFTNWDMLASGDIICVACQFAVDDRSLLLQERTSKEKPQRMRNYSHFVIDGAWLPLHKGQKGEMLAALRRAPDVAVVAISGQKHLLFRSRPGWWQVEEIAAPPSLARLDACIAPIETLYRIFSKEEIAGDQYAPHRMAQYVDTYGLDSLQDALISLRSQRGTLAFDLALFLAQKQENGHDALRDSAAVSECGDTARPALARAGQRLQEPLRPHDLDAVRKSDSQRRDDEQSEPLLQHSLFAHAD